VGEHARPATEEDIHMALSSSPGPKTLEEIKKGGHGMTFVIVKDPQHGAFIASEFDGDLNVHPLGMLFFKHVRSKVQSHFGQKVEVASDDSWKRAVETWKGAAIVPNFLVDWCAYHRPLTTPHSWRQPEPSACALRGITARVIAGSKSMRERGHARWMWAFSR